MPPYRKLVHPMHQSTHHQTDLSALVHVPVENESFTTADLRLCFRICRLLVFSCSGSYFMSLHNEIATRERPFAFYGGGAGRKKKYLGQVKFYCTYCITCIYK